MKTPRILQLLAERRTTTLHRLEQAGFEFAGTSLDGHKVYQNDKAELLYDTKKDRVISGRVRVL